MDSNLIRAPAEVQNHEILLGVKISSKWHCSPVGCHKRNLL